MRFFLHCYDARGVERCGMDWSAAVPLEVSSLAGARAWARAWIARRPAWAEPVGRLELQGYRDRFKVYGPPGVAETVEVL